MAFLVLCESRQWVVESSTLGAEGRFSLAFSLVFYIWRGRALYKWRAFGHTVQCACSQHVYSLGKAYLPDSAVLTMGRNQAGEPFLCYFSWWPYGEGKMLERCGGLLTLQLLP